MTIRKHFWTMTAWVAFLAVVASSFDVAQAQKAPEAKDPSKTPAAGAATPPAAATTPASAPTAPAQMPAASAQAKDDDDADDADDNDKDGDDNDKDDGDNDKDGDADDQDKHDEAGKDDAADDDGKALESQAKLTFEQAKAAALAASPGSLVEEIDLEKKDGKLVYEVEMADKKIRIDATTGAVVSTKQRKGSQSAPPTR